MTARTRLALLYTGLVLAAGLVLIGLTYLLVSQDRPRMLAVRAGGTGVLPDVDEMLGSLEDLRTQTLTQLLTQSGIALSVVVVLAAVLGWLVAGRVLRPIRAVSATARRLSAEDLSARVPVPTPKDELATLAETINSMLDRIQSGVADRDRLLENQRMFVANAAHELRTPLTTMRTAIDVTLDGRPSTEELLAMAADVSTAITHSQRTLDGLLVLARSQTGLRKHAVVDLKDVVAETLRGLEGVDVRPDLRPAVVRGEPVLLNRMISNLVDNAVRYNRLGGHITVSTDRAFLRITNTGQLVDPAQAERLFEPFVRASDGNDGVGLGLSIVRAVAEAHEATVSCTAQPDGGLDVMVRFPH